MAVADPGKESVKCGGVCEVRDATEQDQLRPWNKRYSSGVTVLSSCGNIHKNKT